MMDLQPGEVSPGSSSTGYQSASVAPADGILKKLFGQYFDAMINPSINLFLLARRRATWGAIWVQLALVIVAIVVGTGVVNLIQAGILGAANVPGLGTVVLSALVQAIFADIVFVALNGLILVIARVLGGRATFREQLYTALIAWIPLGLMVILTLNAPGLNIIFGAYLLAMTVVLVRAVHVLSIGKALTATVVGGVIVGALTFGLVYLGALALLARL